MCVGFLHKIHRSAQAMKGQRQSHASDRREHAEALVNQTALPQAHGELPDKCRCSWDGGQAVCHSIWAQLDLSGDCRPSWDTGTLL